MRFEKGYLISPYLDQYIYSPGDIISNRKDTKLTEGESSFARINKGIHVYTDKEMAKMSYVFNDRIVAPVWCDKKDFVAESSNRQEAVFTKVTITKHAFQEAIKIT